jgi:hypothetical protein
VAEVQSPLSSLQSAADLLGAIAAAGAALLVRPLVVDIARRREEIATLRAWLDRFDAGAAGRRYLNNFAPLLLHALDRALYFRGCGDAAMAAKFDSVVGHLIAQVRADGGAALDAMRDRRGGA